MTTKKELQKKKEEKEAMLIRAERESNALNTSKYKSSSNAKISKTLVHSLRDEIIKLNEQLDAKKQ